MQPDSFRQTSFTSSLLYLNIMTEITKHSSFARLCCAAAVSNQNRLVLVFTDGQRPQSFIWKPCPPPPQLRPREALRSAHSCSQTSHAEPRPAGATQPQQPECSATRSVTYEPARRSASARARWRPRRLGGETGSSLRTRLADASLEHTETSNLCTNVCCWDGKKRESTRLREALDN